MHFVCQQGFAQQAHTHAISMRVTTGTGSNQMTTQAGTLDIDTLTATGASSGITSTETRGVNTNVMPIIKY